MRRTMQALFVLAIFATPAMAQSESLVIGPTGPLSAPNACPTGGCSSQPNGPIYPSSYGCGNGTGSQLAAYMNSFPSHPNLWDSYPAQRDARLTCLFRHVNGCDCLDPKRNLYSHPSMLCNKGGIACESQGCDRGASKSNESGISKLYDSPAASIQSEPWINRSLSSKPTLPPPPAGAAPAALSTAKAANSGITVKALR